MIQCLECNKKFKRIQWTHLKRHGMTMGEYRDKFPDAILEDPDITNSRKVTYENMILKYGDQIGQQKWDQYRILQSETNTFEYKKKKYGWTKEQFDVYNKSRGCSGESNGNYKLGYYQSWVKKYGKLVADKMNHATTKKKIRIGIANGNYKRTKSNKELENMRNAAIARVKRQNGIMLSYNPASIPIIEEYGIANNYTFQHAENGGEVNLAGYLVDGYDIENNVVVEYYEKFHYNKSKIEKDAIRQQRIMEAMNCKFIVISYKNTITEYEN
jgi:hypothetical protein